MTQLYILSYRPSWGCHRGRKRPLLTAIRAVALTLPGEPPASHLLEKCRFSLLGPLHSFLSRSFRGRERHTEPREKLVEERMKNFEN